MLTHEKVMNIIGDYDVVVDNPEKYIPYAIFCSTIDAVIFMESLKESSPEINWETIKLYEWQQRYKG